MSSIHTSVAESFLSTKGNYLLPFGILIAFLEFLALFIVAKMEGVLVIQGGIGLLQQYGLYASLFGDAFLLFLAKKYVETLFEVDNSSVFSNLRILQTERESLSSMLRLETIHRNFFYLFVFIGFSTFLANICFHILGQAEEHWGKPVFDSRDHIWCFLVNKATTFYSWVFVLPFSSFIILVTSLQFHKMINRMVEDRAIKYDLFNPDRCGGGSFIGLSQVYFNLAISFVYIQITLHIAVFEKLNIEYIIYYIIITIFFIFGNTIYNNGIYNRIENLRIKSLNKYKYGIYNKDRLSLDIYKYYNEYFFKGSYVEKFSLTSKATKIFFSCLPLGIKLLNNLF